MAFRDFRENAVLTAEQMDDDVVAHLVHPVLNVQDRAATFATSARRPRGKLVVNLNATTRTVPGRPGIGGGQKLLTEHHSFKCGTGLIGWM